MSQEPRDDAPTDEPSPASEEVIEARDAPAPEPGAPEPAAPEEAAPAPEEPAPASEEPEPEAPSPTPEPEAPSPTALVDPPPSVAPPESHASPAPAHPPPGPAASEPPAPPDRRRRWRRRAAWAAAGLALLLVVLEVGAPFVLPVVLRSVADGLGQELRVERARVSLLAGEVELRGVVATPKTGGAPAARVDYLRADLAVTRLLLGQVVVDRVDLDGLALHLQRAPDGAWTVPGLTLPAGDDEVAPPPAAASSPALPDLSWLRVRGVALRRVRLRLSDPSPASPLDVEATVDVRLADLDASGAGPPATLEVDAIAAETGDLVAAGARTLERLRLEGTLVVSPRALRWRLATRLDGLAPGQLDGLLRPLGVAPVAGRLDARCVLSGSVTPALAAPDALALACALEEVRLLVDGRPEVALGRVEASVDALGLGRLEVGGVRIDGVAAEVTRTRSGALRVAGVELAAAPAAASASAVTSDARASVASAGAAPGAPPALVVRGLDLHDARLTVHDEAAGTTVGLIVQDLALSRVHLGPGAPPEPLSLAATLALPGVAEAVALQGTARLSHARWAFDLATRVRGVAPRALRPYLRQAGLESLLDAGEATFHAAGRAALVDGALELEATLRDVVLRDRGVELAGLDEVALEGGRVAPLVGPREVSVTRVVVRRPRAALARDEAGALLVGGVRVEPGAADPAPSAPAAAAAPDAAPPRLSVGLLEVEGASARLDDAAVTPPAALAVEDAGLRVEGLVIDPGAPADAPGAPVEVRAWAQVAGAGRVALEARAVASLSAPSFTLRVTGERLALGPLRPYLRAAGLDGRLEAGALEVVARGELRRAGRELALDLALERARLTEAGQDLLALEGARIEGARVTAGRVDVEGLSLERLSLAAAREAGGALEALGVAVAPVGSRVEAAPAPRPAPAPRAAPDDRPGERLPRVRLGALRVGEVAVRLVDRDRPTPLELPVSLALTCGPLEVDLAGEDAPVEAAYRVDVRAPGLAERGVVEGALALGPKAARLRGDVRLEGLFGSSALVDALGLESAPRDGRLALSLAAQASLGAQGLAASAAVEQVALVDASGEPLLGLDALRVDGARVAGDGTSVEVATVEVVGPRVRIERAPSGQVAVAGVAPAPRAPTDATASEPAAAGEPAPPPRLALGALRVSGAEATWIDRAAPVTTEAVTLVARADLSLEGLELRPDAAPDPARLSVALAVPGVVDALALQGTLAPGRAGALDAAATLALDARGVRAGAAAAYLPPGVSVDVEDGRLRAGLRARVRAAPEGGLGAWLGLDDLEWRDGEAPPLARVERVDVAAPRLDPAGGALKVERVVVAGVELAADVAPGRASALGVTVAPAGAAASAGDVAAVTSGAPPAARRRLPLVEVDELRVELRRVEVRRAGAAPLVAALTLGADEPVRLGGTDPAGLPPVALALAGEVAPLVSALHVRVEAAPFAPDPWLEVGVDLAGLRGEGLLAALPEVTHVSVPPGGLVDGVASARLHAALRARRSDPTDFGFLARPFGAEVTVEGVSLRARPDGPVLLGIQGVQADVASIDPGTGDVRVRALEVTRPILRAARAPDGLHVGGLVVALPAAPPADAAASTSSSSTPAVEGPEVRIDTLLVNEVEVEVLDRTVDPVATLPLSGLDLNVVGLTSRLVQEPRTLRFDLALEGGRAALRGASFAPGEQVRVFEEVLVSGELALVPRPTGRVEVRVSAFELTAIAGLAKRFGTEIGDGVLDLEARVLLHPDGGVDLVSRTRLERLDLTEPEDGGFLRRVLVLPAPTNYVIKLLRDEDGALEIPFDLEVPASGVSLASVMGEVGKVIGGLFLDALKSSPLRLAGGLLDVGSFVGENLGLLEVEAQQGEEALAVAFDVGDTRLVPDERARLDDLVRRLRDDEALEVRLQYVPGGADLACLGQAGEPSPDDLRDVVEYLRARWRELERERDALAAEARAAFLAGITEEGLAAARRAAALEAEIGRTLQALDAACLELRSARRDGGARWLRRALLLLGEERLARVRAALVEGLGEAGAARVRVGRASAPEAPGEEPGRVKAILRKKR